MEGIAVEESAAGRGPGKCPALHLGIIPRKSVVLHRDPESARCATRRPPLTGGVAEKFAFGDAP